MRSALDSFEVRGVRHNIDFLNAIMREDRFQDGALTTAFVDETWPDGFAGAELGDREQTVLAGVALLVAPWRVSAFLKIALMVNLQGGAIGEVAPLSPYDLAPVATRTRRS